jgi:hypothetical protein
MPPKTMTDAVVLGRENTKRLSLHPASRCTLELNGQSVCLSVAELSELRDCLLDSGRSPEAALSKETFRRLFEAGIVAPAEISPEIESSHWRTALPTLTLSPFLRLQPVFLGGKVAMQSIDPPIAMFLEPEFVEAAAQLSGAIQRALGRMVDSCAIRGVSLPRDKALALTHKIAWTWLQSRPELIRWIKWGLKDDGSLDVSVPDYGKLATPGPAFPWLGLTVSLPGRRESSQERQVVLPVEALKPLARVVDALRGAWGDASVEVELAQTPVQRVLGAIEAVGGFIDRCNAPSAFENGSRDEDVVLTVTHMGHASLVIEGGSHRILIDPWLFAWNDEFEKQPLVSRQLGRVDAIFFTHHDADHLSVESLLTLPHDVPVFVPSETGTPLEPRTAKFLRLIGFQDVRELSHGESYLVGDGLSVEAVSFFGEGRNRLGFGANCYLISRRRRNVLIHADASPDSEGRSIVSTGLLKQIVDRHGAVQVVFGTWWQERAFVCNLSRLAIFCPAITPDTWLNDTEKCDCSPEFLRDLVQVAGAKLLLLYAESGEECFLPRQCMSADIPSISLLWKPVVDIRKIIREQVGADVVEAHPYLRVVVPEQGAPHVDQSDVAESWNAV